MKTTFMAHLADHLITFVIGIIFVAAMGGLSYALFLCLDYSFKHPTSFCTALLAAGLCYLFGWAIRLQVKNQ